MATVQQTSVVDDLLLLIKEASNTRGLAKLAYLESARALYQGCNKAQTKQLTKRIHGMTREELAVLIGVGMKQPIRTIVLKRYMETIGRKI